MSLNAAGNSQQLSVNIENFYVGHVIGKTLPFSLSLSFSLSLTHTHTHTHAHISSSIISLLGDDISVVTAHLNEKRLLIAHIRTNNETYYIEVLI